MSFYEGTCEYCGQFSKDRDCYYNHETGEEKYLCPECARELNTEVSDEHSA